MNGDLKFFHDLFAPKKLTMPKRHDFFGECHFVINNEKRTCQNNPFIRNCGRAYRHQPHHTQENTRHERHHGRVSSPKKSKRNLITIPQKIFEYANPQTPHSQACILHDALNKMRIHNDLLSDQIQNFAFSDVGQKQSLKENYQLKKRLAHTKKKKRVKTHNQHMEVEKQHLKSRIISDPQANEFTDTSNGLKYQLVSTIDDLPEKSGTRPYYEGKNIADIAFHTPSNVWIDAERAILLILILFICSILYQKIFVPRTTSFDRSSSRVILKRE